MRLILYKKINNVLYALLHFGKLLFRVYTISAICGRDTMINAEFPN